MRVPVLNLVQGTKVSRVEMTTPTLVGGQGEHTHVLDRTYIERGIAHSPDKGRDCNFLGWKSSVEDCVVWGTRV